MEKLIKADLVRGNEGWQDTRLIFGIKEVTRNQSSRGKRGFEEKKEGLLAKDGEGRKRVCVYCDSENHSSKDCSIITDVDKRKKLSIAREVNTMQLTHKCLKCNMKYHSSICTKKEQLLTANEQVMVH